VILTNFYLTQIVSHYYFISLQPPPPEFLPFVSPSILLDTYWPETSTQIIFTCRKGV